MRVILPTFAEPRPHGLEERVAVSASALPLIAQAAVKIVLVAGGAPEWEVSLGKLVATAGGDEVGGAVAIPGQFTDQSGQSKEPGDAIGPEIGISSFGDGATGCLSLGALARTDLAHSTIGPAGLAMQAAGGAR